MFWGYLIAEIDVVRAGQQEEKDRRKREKTVVTGDMHPLLNALPSLGELIASQNEKKQKSKKPKGTPKMKIVKKEMYVYSQHLYLMMISKCTEIKLSLWINHHPYV